VKEVFYDFDQQCRIRTGNFSKRFMNQLQVYSFALIYGHNKFAETYMMCVCVWVVGPGIA
jgi:hypothetical protein